MSQSPNYEKIIKNLERKIKSEKNKHHKKITKLVKEYTSKYSTRKKFSPILVNVNERRNRTGKGPRKRRPMSEKMSQALRYTFNNPNEQHAWRPGARHYRHMVFEKAANPNPYVK